MSALLWLATYLTHSTLCLSVVLFVRRRLRDEPALEAYWRAAVLVPIATSTIAWYGAGAPWQVDLSRWPAVESVAILEAAPSGSVHYVQFFAPAIAVLFLLGAGRFVLDLLQRGIFLRRLARHPVDGAIVRDLRDLQTLTGLTRDVQLTSSRLLASPIAIGTREICLPSRVLEELGRREQRACLAHELAHMQRQDELWSYVLCAIQRVLWIQPLNRTARRELQHLSESACDAWAADRLGDREGVARCLVSIATWPRASAPIGIHTASGAGSLVRRVEQLLSSQPPRTRSSATAIRVSVSVAGLVLWSIPGIALPPEPSREYWIGFELGRRYRAEHPAGAGTNPARVSDVQWRVELERQLQKQQARPYGR